MEKILNELSTSQNRSLERKCWAKQTSTMYTFVFIVVFETEAHCSAQDTLKPILVLSQLAPNDSIIGVCPCSWLYYTNKDK